MSLADAFRKAGVVSEEQYNKHQESKRKTIEADEQLKAFAANGQWMSYYLGQMEQLTTEFFSSEMLQIAKALGSFANKFKDHPQVRKSIDFHLEKIREKQKWKLETDYSGLIGNPILGALVGARAELDANMIWAIRATGYALLGVLEAHPRYSKQTKEEVLAWVKENRASLNL